ncbi:Hypp6116 [Branchiostoma lanceolatum]|uniref:Hypp6116 protein n=1 Tax=Branchiostoma lanceolatum TaxID=7740 RepID=A0A8J9VMD6_BRALA|nr:Hypp6116 [Branchiostoma lanceolatum]
MTVGVIKAFAHEIEKISAKAKGEKPRFKETVPRKRWWKGFKGRHPDLTLRSPDQLDKERALSSTPKAVFDHYERLEEILDEPNAKDKKKHIIYNADETEVDLSAKSSKVIVLQGSKRSPSRRAGGRDHISVLVCVSAAGQTVHPMIIYSKAFPAKDGDGVNTVKLLPAAAVNSLITTVEAIIRRNAEEGKVTWQELWIKVLGDHGGGSFKVAFQVLNKDSPNSKSNTVVFSIFNAKDSMENLATGMGRFSKEIAELQGRECILCYQMVELFGSVSADYALLTGKGEGAVKALAMLQANLHKLEALQMEGKENAADKLIDKEEEEKGIRSSSDAAARPVQHPGDARGHRHGYKRGHRPPLVTTPQQPLDAQGGPILRMNAFSKEDKVIDKTRRRQKIAYFRRSWMY